LTHGFIQACRDAGVRFSVGHDLTEAIRTACLAVPEQRWVPAITADGSDLREGAEVAEITDLVDLRRWPPGTRAVARREAPHPGAAEPNLLRYCLLHAGATIARSRRRTRLRLAASWPWANQLVAAFGRVNSLRLQI